MKRSIFNSLHSSTPRNYIERMSTSKVECMNIASSFSRDYWDGERKYGYGGYHYDGRWERVARTLIDSYGLTKNSKVLDLGCGKGFLLYEIKKLTDCEVVGLDISQYALENSHPSIKKHLNQHNIANELPFKDSSFDLVLSLMTLHNLNLIDVESSLKEINRVGKNAYITVESYRNNQELFNLQCWALTCKSFFSPEEWEYLFSRCNYTKDFEFLFFE